MMTHILWLINNDTQRDHEQSFSIESSNSTIFSEISNWDRFMYHSRNSSCVSRTCSFSLLPPGSFSASVLAVYRAFWTFTWSKKSKKMVFDHIRKSERVAGLVNKTVEFALRNYACQNYKKMLKEAYLYFKRLKNEFFTF